MRSRGFFTELAHPVVGAVLQASHPVRFGAGPASAPRRSAPCLGEHNTDVLSHLLGMSDADITDLCHRGIIGDHPSR